MAMEETIGTAVVELEADFSQLEKAMKDLEKTMEKVLKDLEKVVEREMKGISNAFENGMDDADRAIQNSMGDIEDSFRDGMGDSERAVDQGMGDIESAMRNGIDDAEQSIDNSMQDIESSFRDGMRDSERAVDQGMQDIENSVEDGASNMEDTINNAVTGIVAAFAAIGIGAFTVASDFEKANGTLQVALGLTAEEADATLEHVEDLWLKGFGQNIEDATSKVALAKQALGDINDVDFDKVVQAADALEKKMGVDFNDTLKTVDTMMNVFGMTGEEAMDVIVTGFQMGLDKSGDFLDTLNEYSGYFNSIGLDAEDMLNILNAGLEAGAFNADKVADAVKEFNIRIKDGSDTSREAIQDLGMDYDQLSKDIAAGGEKGEAAFHAIVVAISQIEDPIERNRIGVALFGTQWEDLESTVVTAMANAGDSVGEMEGKTDEVIKTMENEHKGTWEDIWRQMQEAMKPVGEELMRLADQYMPAFEAAMGGLAELSKAFAGVSQNTVANAASWTILGLTIWGVADKLFQFKKTFKDFDDMLKNSKGGGLKAFMDLLKNTGNHGGRLTRIFGGFLRIGPALGSMFAALATPVGLIVAAVVAAGAAFAALWVNWDKVTNETFEWIDVLAVAVPAITVAVGAVKTFFQMFEDGIPAFDAFDLKVSDSTAKTMNDYMAMEDSATTSLYNMTWGVLPTTAEALTSLQSQFATLADGVIKNFQKQRDESIAILEEQMATSVLMTSQEKEEILKLVNDKYTEQIKTVDDGKKRINEILEAAKNEGRTITQAEQNEIIAIKNKQRELAVQAATTSKEEQELILNKLKDSATEITARQAAAVVANSKKQMDETIKNAEKEKEERIANADNLYYNLGSISEQQYKDLVADANKQYTETVGWSKKQHSEVVKEAQEQAGEHAGWVDWETGEIMSYWQKMGQDIGKNAKTIQGLLGDLQGVYQTLRTEVLKIIGSMTGGWDDFSAQVAESVEVARKAINGFIKKYNSMSLSVPTIDIPGVGKVGGFSWSPPDIPYLAKGGLTTGPTLAMIGEGRHEEAVVPLSDKVFGKLADGIMDRMGGGSGVTNNITTTASPSDIQRYTERALRKQALNWGL